MVVHSFLFDLKEGAIIFTSTLGGDFLGRWGQILLASSFFRTPVSNFLASTLGGAIFFRVPEIVSSPSSTTL